MLPWGSVRKLQPLLRSSGGRCAGRRRPQDWSDLRSSRDAPSSQRGWGRSQRWRAGYAEQGLLRADGSLLLIAVTVLAGKPFSRKKKRSQPRASMPGGLPKMGLSPGVELVPGVGASLRGVGVLDLRPGVEDLSFCGWKERAATITILQTRRCRLTI